MRNESGLVQVESKEKIIRANLERSQVEAAKLLPNPELEKILKSYEEGVVMRRKPARLYNLQARMESNHK